MNGTFIYKFLAVLNEKKILGNKCFSEQIFYRKCRSMPLNFQILDYVKSVTGSDKPDTVCGRFGPDEEDVNEYFLSQKRSSDWLKFVL